MPASQPMSKARLYDLIAASPLIIFYVFAIAGFVLQIHSDFQHELTFLRVLPICARITSAIFAALQVFLFIVRRPPIAKAKGWWPRIVAVIGANSALLFFLLPSGSPATILSLMSFLFTTGGTVASIVILSHLGRSFSITPQARELIISGPYRLIRHPLYLAEQVSCFGIMWQYKQPWALLVFVIGLMSQFPRMQFEEQVLASAFPAYRAYLGRTARLIPGIY